MNQQAIGKFRWTICTLLFCSTTVNYLDRQVFSLLAPDLSRLFNWSNSDYANITAVFQFVFAISMVVAGRVVDGLGTKLAFTVAILIWSFGAVMHAFALDIGTAVNDVIASMGWAAVQVSIAGFMLARAVLAVGEAGNFPAAIKATAEYFPKHERSLATGIFNSGANVGAILAPLCVPPIAAHWGWQAAFIVIGAIGFVWMLAWQLVYAMPAQQKRLGKAEFAYIHSDSIDETGQETDHVRQGTGSWFMLLGYRQTWAFAFGKFMTDGVWWFFLFWLPKYLSSQFGMSNTELALPLAVLYSMTMVGSIAGGWFPAYFMHRGHSPYNGRMKAMLLIAFVPLTVLLAQPLGGISYWVPVILIGLGASAHQAWSANLFTTVSDMFPKRSVGSVVGIGGMAGGLGGVVVSKLGGWLTDYYGALGRLQTGYMIMFSICAVAYLVAWSGMKLLVPRHQLIADQ